MLQMTKGPTSFDLYMIFENYLSCTNHRFEMSNFINPFIQFLKFQGNLMIKLDEKFLKIVRQNNFEKYASNPSL